MGFVCVVDSVGMFTCMEGCMARLVELGGAVDIVGGCGFVVS